MERKLEKWELGDLENCQNCSKPTYAQKNLPAESCTLPSGFTVANRRMTVVVHTSHLHVCADCRYNAFGGY